MIMGVVVAVRATVGTMDDGNMDTVRVSRCGLAMMVNMPEAQQEQHAQYTDQERAGQPGWTVQLSDRLGEKVQASDADHHASDQAHE